MLRWGLAVIHQEARKQPATSSCRKHTAASTTSSVDYGANVRGTVAAATATASTIAMAELTTAIAATSSIGTADGILDNDTNNTDVDKSINFIPSPPCHG